MNANDLLSYYYRRPSPRLWLPILHELLPLNGPETNSYAPMMFGLAAVLRRVPALAGELLEAGDAAVTKLVEEARSEPHDVLAYGAQGPNSVNCLWATFFATGEREVLLRLIEALPSWHFFHRQMIADGVDPARALVQGAGHSVAWSLAANAYQHTRVLLVCEQERDAPGQPLAARDELAGIVARARERRDRDGPCPAETATLAYLAQHGEGEERPPLEPWVATPLEPSAGLPAPPPDDILAALPSRWRTMCHERHPALEDLERAARDVERAATEAATPLARARATLHHALLCLGGRFSRLAELQAERAHRAFEDAAGPDLARAQALVVQAEAQLLGEAAAAVPTCARALALLEPSAEASVELVVDVHRLRIEAAHKAKIDTRPLRQALVDFLERRLGEGHAAAAVPLGAALRDQASCLPAEISYVARRPGYQRSAEILDAALAEGRPGAAAELLDTLNYLAGAFVSEKRYPEAVAAYERALALLPSVATAGPALRSQLIIYRAIALARDHDASAPSEGARALAELEAFAAEHAEHRPFLEWARGELGGDAGLSRREPDVSGT